MIGEIVYLQTNLADTKFYPYIPLDTSLKHRWYEGWWAAHIDKPAKVIFEKGDTLHIQFEDEQGTSYVVSRAYLR